jgi:hypothetical protein
VAMEELERANGMSSPQALKAQLTLVSGLSIVGRTREAFTVARDAHRRARELYAPASYTLRTAMEAHAVTAANVGELEIGRELVASLRTLPASADRQASVLDLLELGLLQYGYQHEEVLRMASALRARFASRGDAADQAWLELIVVQSLLALGRRSEAHEVLAGPLLQLQDYGEPREDESITTAIVVLAVLGQAPPPPGTTWRSRLPPGDLTLFNRQLAAVGVAIETAAEPTPTVRRLRDELAATYHDGDIYVQLLDGWLAAAERGSP